MDEGGKRADGGASRAALVGFREGFYACLTGWGDALFELCDAAVCAPTPVGSVPSLSLEPVFRRGHGSLYKALARGAADAEALRDVLVAHRPADWPAVFAVDASTWPRCDAETSPERGFCYSASKHSAVQPIVAGWSYQWIAQLDWAADSWTAPLDARRIPPRADTVAATIAQVGELVGRLPDAGAVPLFVFDAGYDPIALGAGLAGARAGVLVRIRSDRVFYPDPVPTPATARWRSRPGTACTPSSTGGDAGPAPSRRLCAGRSSASRSSTFPNATAERSRPSGYGGRGQEPPSSRSAGERTCTASTSSTPSASPRGPGLDDAGPAHPRTGRPLDLARRRRLHPAPPRPRPRRRRPAALGTPL